MDILKQISESLQKGDHEKVAMLTSQAIEEKIPVKKILDEGLIAGMNVVGEEFKHHRIFLPSVLLAARAMYAGMDLIKPLMIRDNIPTIGKVVIGTIKGDLHDIGKNLVGIMLKGAGFEVIDLGNDVTPDRFVQAAKDEKADAVGMSALLTTTMTGMKDVIELMKSEGIYGKIKVIIGGAPVNREFAEQIGADSYAYDGMKAVEILKEYVKDK
ncbi:MAG TPA: cobalamin-binding protein [candidate division Zixibacteria bacterium]|nr:cobalamin-binding protein [candidate division Zixibacteria bacterium]